MKLIAISLKNTFYPVSLFLTLYFFANLDKCNGLDLSCTSFRLFDKHKQLELAQETIADKEDHISVLNSTKEDLQSIIEDKDKQIEEYCIFYINITQFT